MILVLFNMPQIEYLYTVEHFIYYFPLVVGKFNHVLKRVTESVLLLLQT